MAFAQLSVFDYTLLESTINKFRLHNTEEYTEAPRLALTCETGGSTRPVLSEILNMKFPERKQDGYQFGYVMEVISSQSEIASVAAFASRDGVFMALGRTHYLDHEQVSLEHLEELAFNYAKAHDPRPNNSVGWQILLKITGPRQPDLTIFELPQTDYHPSDWPGRFFQCSSSIASETLRLELTAILAVVPVNKLVQSLTSRSARGHAGLPELVEEKDPTHVRTILIIPDASSLDPGSDEEKTCIEFMTAESELCGRHILLGCQEADALVDKSVEMVFFDQEAWRRVATNRKGSSALTAKLKEVFAVGMVLKVKRIFRNLQHQKRISEYLTSYHDYDPTSAGASYRHLDDVISRYKFLLKQAFTYRDPSVPYFEDWEFQMYGGKIEVIVATQRRRLRLLRRQQLYVARRYGVADPVPGIEPLWTLEECVLWIKRLLMKSDPIDPEPYNIQVLRTVMKEYSRWWPNAFWTSKVIIMDGVRRVVTSIFSDIPNRLHFRNFDAVVDMCLRQVEIAYQVEINEMLESRWTEHPDSVHYRLQTLVQQYSERRQQFIDANAHIGNPANRPGNVISQLPGIEESEVYKHLDLAAVWYHEECYNVIEEFEWIFRTTLRRRLFHLISDHFAAIAKQGADGLLDDERALQNARDQLDALDEQAMCDARFDILLPLLTFEVRDQAIVKTSLPTLWLVQESEHEVSDVEWCRSWQEVQDDVFD